MDLDTLQQMVISDLAALGVTNVQVEVISLTYETIASAAGITWK